MGVLASTVYERFDAASSRWSAGNPYQSVRHPPVTPHRRHPRNRAPPTVRHLSLHESRALPVVVRRRPRPASVLDVATLARSFPQLHDALFTAALFELCWFSDDDESHTVQRFGLLVTTPSDAEVVIATMLPHGPPMPAVRPTTPPHHHTYRGVDTRLPRRPAPHRHDALQTTLSFSVLHPRPRLLSRTRSHFHSSMTSSATCTGCTRLRVSSPQRRPSSYRRHHPVPALQALKTEVSISPSHCSTRSSSRQTTSPGRSSSTSSPSPCSLTLPSFLKFVGIFPQMCKIHSVHLWNRKNHKYCEPSPVGLSFGSPGICLSTGTFPYSARSSAKPHGSTALASTSSSSSWSSRLTYMSPSRSH